MRSICDAELGARELLMLSRLTLELMVDTLFDHLAIGYEALDAICAANIASIFGIILVYVGVMEF